MLRLIQIPRLVLALLFTARLCQAACIPENSPPQPNGDAMARLLEAQARCPVTALEFRNLVERAGGRLETTMVNFLSFHNPDPGAFFLFEIASGTLTAPNVTVARGDLLFGHFLTGSGSSLVMDTQSSLIVEAIAWDPNKQLFNFYELVLDGRPPRPVWFYRGDSKLVLEDIQFLYRERSGAQKPFRAQLRCSGCHTNGGLVQKELAPPHNDWWMNAHKLPFGDLTPDATVAKIFKGLVDADELMKLVEASTHRLAASPTYRKVLQSRSMQEQLRPLFCPVELNIESDRAFDPGSPTVEIPARFFSDARLGAAAIVIPRKNYDPALQRLRSRMPELAGRTDADHAWLTPVKATSDVALTDALVEMGVIDNEFVADVLAVDFTSPFFSSSRCGLIKLVPESGPNFLPRFQAALRASSNPAAKVLLENLSDPKRDAKFHRQQVSAYLTACQTRASKPEAAIEWFSLLAQRRAEIGQLEISTHPRGNILESPNRVVFPAASTSGGRLDLATSCEARPPR